jgi:para-aminobenzoate synthetase
MPDAILLFIDRFIAVDHRTNELYLAALHCGTAFSVETWLTYVEGVLDTLPVSGEKPRMNPRLLASCDVEPFLLHDRDTYLRQIVLAKQKIVEGESYEICLTNRVRVLSR